MEIKDMVELMKAVSENGLTSFEMEKDDVRIVMKREEPAAAVSGLAMGVSGMPAAVPGMAGASGVAMAASGMPAVVPGMAAAPGVAMPASEMPAVAPMPASGMPSAAPDSMAADNIVTCPLVGTFYSSPSPDAGDFVKVGDQVKKGQVLGIVEAMKLMNEIESEYDGVVEAVLVKNEETVEYGQPLFRIR